MIIKNIEYSKRFFKDLNKLPEQIVKIALRKEQLFKYNPLHPSLRLHSLKGNLKGTKIKFPKFKEQKKSLKKLTFQKIINFILALFF